MSEKPVGIHVATSITIAATSYEPLPELDVEDKNSVRCLYILNGNTAELQLVVDETDTIGIPVPTGGPTSFGDDGDGGLSYNSQLFPKFIYNPSASSVDVDVTATRTR